MLLSSSRILITESLFLLQVFVNDRLSFALITKLIIVVGFCE